MLLPIDDDIFEKGFCFGQYEPKLDDESRLHIPKEVVNSLREHGVTKLYRCPDPTAQRFILCPAENWKAFVEQVKKHFEGSDDSEQAYRLLCSATAGNIDSQDRIRITKVCLDHAKLNQC